ncbi:hypothetical protein J3P71_12730 [Rhizobium leguminosarum]|nr:hypothetical protein [Rhizobium leguminosarum]NKK99764.1 hypothetical protein [Rhizobium leguminosarum bv. viciae]MBY5837956.1 hypothetical protein [Rhizobium leguminosarum]NKL81202.1 hypothetical protein [Rhizobium leguminosarum bv. viciae]NKM77264.1 hypothetical protein [Rhizobium leguminosarum bv. viciae]
MPVAVNRTVEAVTPDFVEALERLPDGYVEGTFQGRKWGSTIKRSDDGRRTWLYAEELGGTDVVSFNLYIASANLPVLKPCEMSSEKVVRFVLEYVP